LKTFENNIQSIDTSLVEQVLGQNLSKCLIIGSAKFASFSINCTTQYVNLKEKPMIYNFSFEILIYLWMK